MRLPAGKGGRDRRRGVRANLEALRSPQVPQPLPILWNRGEKEAKGGGQEARVRDTVLLRQSDARSRARAGARESDEKGVWQPQPAAGRRATRGGVGRTLQFPFRNGLPPPVLVNLRESGRAARECWRRPGAAAGGRSACA